MKKLLLSSVILLLFSASVMLFQLSCKKEVLAQIPALQQNKIIYLNQCNNLLYSANYDGSNKTVIPISLPAHYIVDDILSISPDRKTIFISTLDTIKLGVPSLYRCNADGTAPQEIASQGGTSAEAY
jgi:hypothetical protein